jgi:hypothetical protein
MASVDSGGTMDRIIARSLFNVLRAGSGTPARYSSTVAATTPDFAAELESSDFGFFMRTILRRLPSQVYTEGGARISFVKEVSLL